MPFHELVRRARLRAGGHGRHGVPALGRAPGAASRWATSTVDGAADQRAAPAGARAAATAGSTRPSPTCSAFWTASSPDGSCRRVGRRDGAAPQRRAARAERYGLGFWLHAVERRRDARRRRCRGLVPSVHDPAADHVHGRSPTRLTERGRSHGSSPSGSRRRAQRDTSTRRATRDQVLLPVERVRHRPATRRRVAAHRLVAGEARLEHALSAGQARQLPLEVLRPGRGQDASRSSRARPAATACRRPRRAAPARAGPADRLRRDLEADPDDRLADHRPGLLERPHDARAA